MLKPLQLTIPPALWLSVVLIVAAVFLWGVWTIILFPPGHPRVFMNQHRTVRVLRDLNLAEHVYAAKHPDLGFACRLGDLAELAKGPTPEVDAVYWVADGNTTKNAYRFEVQCPDGRSRPAKRYTITAVPTVPGSTGEYALCTDQSSELWYSGNGSAADCLVNREWVEQKYR